MATKRLTINEVSSLLVEAYASQIDIEQLKQEKQDIENAKDRNYTKYIFATLLHTNNSKGKELIEVYGEDDAIHAVNIALAQLRGSIISQIVEF